MGVSVTVIDKSDYTGRAAAFTHGETLHMTGVVDMVAKVLAYLAGYAPMPNSPVILYDSKGVPILPARGVTKMSRLNIIDHGNLGGMDFGTDPVTTASFAKFKPEFEKLTPKFEADAFVHLQHCFAATNLTLMAMFADTFNVPVVGGDDLQYAYARLNLGNYIRVYPMRGGSRPANDTFFFGP